MGKFSSTMSLMSGSWKVVKESREILALQAISFASSLIVAMVFILPIIDGGSSSYSPPEQGAEMGEQIAYYLKVYLVLLCNYFVVIFFNVAIIHCAIKRLKGNTSSVSDGISAAIGHLPAILGWTLISATVGLILRIIEDKSETLGQIVAGFIGLAWNMSVFFVIPIMVVRKKGPLESVSDSAKLIRDTWAEQLLSNISYGLVYFVFSLIGIALLLTGYLSEPGAMRTFLFASGILYMIALAVVFSALESIFKSALYLSKRHENRSFNYESDLLDSYKPQT